MPCSQAFGLVARQASFAVTVFEGLDRDADKIADFYIDFATIVVEFFSSNVAFGFEAGVDHNKIVINANDFGGNHFADAHFFEGQTLFKECGKAFGGSGLRGWFHHRNQQVNTPITETGVGLNKPRVLAARGTG